MFIATIGTETELVFKDAMQKANKKIKYII